jgi:hypothetical protein
MRLRTAFLVLTLFIGSAAALKGQAAPATHIESQQDLFARLTAQQKEQFDAASKDFNAKRYTDALAAYKLLLKDFPGDSLLSKFSSEAALNTGDTSYALDTMKPIAQANPDDWQTVSLLTRACAEAGDKTCRDAGIAHMLDLHKRGITPSRMQQYIVERVKAGGKSLIIFTSLEPWGHYQVYDYAQIFDEAGHLSLRTTIESNDGDQGLFAKQHPTEAASGLRGFSLDGYQDNGQNSSGQKIETHYTFKFFTGQPPYDAVRDAFISIATGQTKPVSSRTNVLSQ